MADILRPQVENEEEEQSEKSLRPQNFDEMIGRDKEKKMLQISINAARARKEPLDHIIFHGPPGLGKTSFAHVIANEMGANIHVTSGPAIERAGDLASIISNLQEGDILFIDEIHRLHKVVEEVLYPAMEDYALDIVLGKGVGAKSVRIDLPRFTVIGATTKIGALTHALRDRFGTVFRLEFYSNDELAELVKQKAKILNTPIDDAAAGAIAQRSRGTARISLRLLKRVRDHAHHLGKKKIDEEAVTESMKLLQVDELGLDENDKKILRLIIENFSGGPVGLNTIAAAISEEEDTIVDVYEPYLIQQGFLNRTPKGRTATQKAYTYLNFRVPEKTTLF